MRSSGTRCLLCAVILAGSLLPIGAAAAATIKCSRASGKCLPAPICQWGRTSSGDCVNARLAKLTQLGTLVFTQLQISQGPSAYLPANSNVERMYPVRNVSLITN